jgi:hypothetical protein
MRVVVEERVNLKDAEQQQVRMTKELQEAVVDEKRKRCLNLAWWVMVLVEKTRTDQQSLWGCWQDMMKWIADVWAKQA